MGEDAMGPKRVDSLVFSYCDELSPGRDGHLGRAGQGPVRAGEAFTSYEASRRPHCRRSFVGVILCSRADQAKVGVPHTAFVTEKVIRRLGSSPRLLAV